MYLDLARPQSDLSSFKAINQDQYTFWATYLNCGVARNTHGKLRCEQLELKNVVGVMICSKAINLTSVNISFQEAKQKPATPQLMMGLQGLVRIYITRYVVQWRAKHA
eukprot:1154669-Pelagomonas_calceolata.AAC.3